MSGQDHLLTKVRRRLSRMLMGDRVANTQQLDSTPTLVEQVVPLTQSVTVANTTPAQRRAVVISNCQCVPIAAWLTTLSADTVFDFWGVHVLQPGQEEAEIDAFIARAKAEYEFIVVIPLSEDYFGLSTSRVADTFSGIPIVRISNIYFSGLHPDLTYIGGLNQRVVGPLSDYHSKLAIYGFLNGLSVENTMALFCSRSYSLVGYYDEFLTSLDILKERDRTVDVPVTRILEEKLRTAICFFSVNHPSSALLSTYCDDIVRYLEERGLTKHSGFPPDPFLCGESLANSVIYPIYPEIAAHHNIAWLGSHSFKKAGTWVNPMDLAHFLTLEFEVFEQVGKETLALSHIAQTIAVRFSVL